MKYRFYLFFCIFFSLPAHAYLDPGSGSLLLYVVIGICTTLIYLSKNLFLQLQLYFFRLLKKNKNLGLDEKNIVFYSEGSQYYSTFQPVIKELSERGIKCTYLTGDKNDPGLSFKADCYDSAWIGNGFGAISSLNHLKARILVMTSPQLEVLYLKRSKQVGYFVHIVHAPTDIFTYKPFPFDFFDAVMVAAPHQAENIRLLENIRKTAKKEILSTGLVYLDYILANKQKKEVSPKNKKITVLVAPTWGVHSLLSRFGFTPIRQLINSEFHVIIRPHPQSYISEMTLMQQLEQEMSKYNKVEIDNNPSGQSAMEQADVMLSDISGIIFDFAFVYEKPILALKGAFDKDKSLEWFQVSQTNPHQTIWEEQVIPSIATIIDTNANTDYALAVKTALLTDTGSTTRLNKLSIFNYGKAGPVAAQQLENILSRTATSD